MLACRHTARPANRTQFVLRLTPRVDLSRPPSILAAVPKRANEMTIFWGFGPETCDGSALAPLKRSRPGMSGIDRTVLARETGYDSTIE
jgi:hypothetical protein